jgi:hypothetical protein
MAADPLSAFLENNDGRTEGIVTTFGSYQPRPVDRERLRAWLRQFRPADYDLALRVLENTQFYDTQRIQRLMADLHGQVKVQLANDGFRTLENVAFLALGRVGESGHEIFTRYRNINRLYRTPAMLPQLLELQQILFEAEAESRDLALVFLDDFIGTGRQVTDYWNEVLSQMIRPTQPLYLATIAACPDGIDKIVRETPFQVIPAHIVQNRHLFPLSDLFTDPEKATITDYCETVGNPPMGIGGLGAMLAFAHGCPNNAVAILRGSKSQRHWRGILPRFDDLP